MDDIGKGKGKFSSGDICDTGSGCTYSGSSGSGGGSNKGDGSGGGGQSRSWLNNINRRVWEPKDEIVIDGDKVVGDGNEEIITRSVVVECTICKDAFLDHSSNPCVRAPCCKAIAHKACVEEWLRRESRCFVCPNIITTRNGRASYFADKLTADDIAAESTQEVQRKIANPGDLKEEFQRAREKFIEDKMRSDDEAFGEFLAMEISGGAPVTDLVAQQEKVLAQVRANKAIFDSLAADEALARKLEEEDRAREASKALRAREELEKSERAARELAKILEKEADEEEAQAEVKTTSKAEAEREKDRVKVRRASPKGGRAPRKDGAVDSRDRSSCASIGAKGKRAGGKESSCQGEYGIIKRPGRLAQGASGARGSVANDVGEGATTNGEGSRQSNRREGREGSSNVVDWRAGSSGGGKDDGLKPSGGRATSQYREHDSDYEEDNMKDDEEEEDEWIEEKYTSFISPKNTKKRRLSNTGASSVGRGGSSDGGISSANQKGSVVSVDGGADSGAGTVGKDREASSAAVTQRRAMRHSNGVRTGITKYDDGDNSTSGESRKPFSSGRAKNDADPDTEGAATDPPLDPLRRAARLARAATDPKEVLSTTGRLQEASGARRVRGGRGAATASPHRAAAAPTAAAVPLSGFRGGVGRGGVSPATAAAVRGGRSSLGGTSAKRSVNSPAKRNSTNARFDAGMKEDARKNAIDLSQAD